MPFKSRSQEDLFMSADAPASAGSGETTDDHTPAVAAMTMTSLLLLRPDPPVSAASTDTVMCSAALSFRHFIDVFFHRHARCDS